ncbi:MFS transporter [Crenalkalicoccus roseus]|uniref:MFS transporter n=1 Tax=Crenalkalicoccus roseus TaxID=1485588 RepID=UPI0010806D0A|nr:MFS transporter [Crenalkalicoccus roseus]
MIRTDGLPAALGATTLCQALATLAVFVLPVLAPLAARDIGLPAHLVGWQVAVVYVFASAGSGLSGGLLARWGPARTTQAALAAVALGCVLIASALVPAILLGSALIGAGYGQTNPAASQVLSRLAPPARRNMVFAVKQTGVPLGAALAGLLLPSVALWLGWRAAALLAAAALALAALGLAAFRPAWDAERDPAAPLRGGTGGALAELRAQPGLTALAIIGALFAAIQLALGAYAVTMLVEEFGWGTVAAGAAAALVQGAGAVARLVWALLADRWRAGLAVLALIGLASAVTAALLPLATAWPVAAVLALIGALGFSAAGWNGVLIAEAARMARAGRAGVATGGVLACTFAGVVAGPSLFALMVGALGGYSIAFAAIAVLPLAGAAVAWRAHRREAAGAAQPRGGQ